MSEFKVHHLISELISLLRRGDKNPAAGAEDYADLLLKSVTPYMTSQVGAGMSIKKLSEKSSVPEEFKRKYADLKAKNVRDLDALVCLLFKISDDETTKTFLARNAQAMLETPVNRNGNSSAAPVAGGHMTAEEMSQLRIRLIKELGHGINRNLTVDVKSGQQKHNDMGNFPLMPSWMKDRTYLTLDFVTDSADLHEPEAVLGAIPLPSQEHALLEDILHCLGGDSGEHILALPLDNAHAVRTFTMDESIDVCFKELIQRILPICSNFSLVSRFIKEKSLFHYGQVNHSLCSAMKSLIKDYLMLVAQLEHQHRLGLLTLQRLWLYVQPTMQTMEILADIALAINKGNAIGGAVLSLLHERTCNMMGDPRAQELCLYLTEAACVPYFEILEKWIYKGIIYDSFGEFLVMDNELVNKEDLPVDYSDDYWEKRCTICKEKIPVFLEKVADMILRTGKYLNVIRQCGRDVTYPDAEGIVYTLNERHYVEKIEKSYSFASKKLLDLLMEEKDLMGRLRSVKHYFLLDQGDFIVQFMDMADEELKKNIDDIMPTRLESLLELALRTSVANCDPYKDDVRVMLLPYDLLSQMFRILHIETKNEEEYKIPVEYELTGLEGFAFHYEVKWPLSLILNRKVLAMYQMLFRQLLYLRHVERLLCNVWISDKVSKCFPLSASLSYAPAFALRQRMLNYVQNLEYYMMFEVIEPSWRIFLNKLQSVANVDEVLRCHFDFLDTCLKDCMLTNPELLRIVNKLMKTFVEFSSFILHMNTYSVDAEMSCMLQTVSESQSFESCSEMITSQTLATGESFEQKIEKFDAEFVSQLIILLDRISDLGRDNYSAKLVNILYRVDFNSFYTERLQRYVAERSMTASLSERPKKKPPVPPKSPRVARMQGVYGDSSG